MSDSEDEYNSSSSSDSGEEESGSEYEAPKKTKAAPKKKAATSRAKKTVSLSSDDDDEDDKPKKKPAASRSKKAAAGTSTSAPKKPAASRSKKGAASASKKKSSSDSENSGLSENERSDDQFNVFKSISADVRKGKTIEEIYQKKELLDQILLRPDTYIGSTERQEEELWVWEAGRMIRKKISFVPGIYKIFDEILVNAADNKQRAAKMTYIKVVINAEEGFISVTNDGESIPIAIHKEHNIYIPELIFGNLLTSSHYDDSEERLTGGRNGFGAKLANIFSTKFIVECSDASSKKLYKQTFTNNMRTKEEPKITAYANKTSYTKITFYPELDRFGMVEFDEDLIALLSKRVYDIAGCNSTLKVHLNGEDLGIKSFEKYIALYRQDDEAPPALYYERCSDRWEIAITLSTEGQFNQVSFVNSICTTKGGTHVTHALTPIIAAISEQIKKKNKDGSEVKGPFIKNHLSVFVNCLIVNPHFDSQTKETLTSKITTFGSRCEPSQQFIKKVIDPKSGIVATIITYAQFKDQNTLRRSTSSAGKKGKVSHPKLDDANLAGSNKSQDCTLILTEGDSAKSLATAGISVVGKDHYGAFPLKGKLLNVREQSSKIVNNDEINNITMILGLKYGKVYEDLDDLRYGHLMIMADQDHDGSHIKGLLINMVHHFWPTLLKMPGFLVEFITPIVKVSKHGQKTISFYTLPEFLKWRETNERGWEIKYYKGLGTSKPSEGKEYFSDLERHKIDFEWDEQANDAIELAFSKSRADDRKKWMAKHVDGTFLEQFGVKKLSYSDFINKELILFSIADCERSIPSIVDGLKTSTRKIMYSCFKRNLKKEIKVAQLIGYVSEHSAYHHGEMSLYSTIVGMAQEFVGSNNINLLNPSGSYGTRIVGGKDCSSARYIHTRLNDIARHVYHADDDWVLTNVVDDGKRVQPKYYIPTIPMILVNGSVGIGTGWSTNIPNYNPRDLIENMRLAIDDKPLKPLKPWYRGHLGEIVSSDSGKVQGAQYISKGVWKKLSDHRFEITELPVSTWTQEYREFLDELETPGTKQKKKEAKEKKTGKRGAGKSAATTKRKTTKKADDDDEDGATLKDQVVKSYTNYSSESTIHFIIDTVLPVDELKIEKVFKLTSNLNETNMVCFDEEGRIQRFATTLAIQEHFFPIRMKHYQMRKDFLSERLAEEYSRLSNKARFILAVVNKELVISNVKKVDLIKKLKEMKFDQIQNKKSEKSVKQKLKKKKGEFNEEDAAVDSEDEEAEDEEEEKDQDAKGYDYLLSLPLWSLTLERVEKIKKERDAKKVEWDTLVSTPITTIYKRDLDELEKSLDQQDENDEKLRNQTESLKKKTKTKALPRAKKISKKVLQETKENGIPGLGRIAKPTAKSSKKPAASVDLTTTTSTSTSGSKPIESFFNKKKPSLGSLNSDDEDFTISDEDKPVITTRAPARKRPATLVIPSDSEDENQDSENSEPDSPPPKRVTKKAAAISKKPAASSVLVSSESEKDDDDDGDQSEPEVPSPPPKKVTKKPAATTTTKKPAAKRTISLDSSDEDEATKDSDDEKVTPPSKKVKSTSAVAPPPKKVTKKPAAKKTAKPKDESFIQDDSDESDAAPMVTSTRTTRVTRGAAKPNLQFLDSSDDDDLYDAEESEESD